MTTTTTTPRTWKALESRAEAKGLTIERGLRSAIIRTSPRGPAVQRYEDGTMVRADAGFDLSLACRMTVRDAATLLGI